MFLYAWAVLVFLGNIFAKSEICNPIECFGELNTIFQPSLDKDSCKKIINIQHCVELCFLDANLDALKKGLELVRQEICEESDGSKLSNKCVNKHKFLLFSCLYKSLNLQANNASIDEDLLLCRKGMEGQHCDQQSLIPCSLHANYVVETLLVKLFQPMIDDHCKSFSYDIWNLDMKQSMFSVDYEDLAVCLDNNNEAVTSCLPVTWSIANAVLSSKTNSKQCKAVGSLTACIHNVIQDNCRNAEAMFIKIKKSLYQYFFPFCSAQKSEIQDFHTQDLPKSERTQVSSSTENTVLDDNLSHVPRKELLKNENQFPAVTNAESSSHSNNISEVVVVHQHIVFNVVEHHHNIGPNIISFQILIFSMLILVLKSKCFF